MPENTTDLATVAKVFVKVATDLHRSGDNGIDELAMLPLIEAWATTLEWAKTAGLTPEQEEGIVSAAQEAQEAYSTYELVHGKNKADALAAVRGYLDVFSAVFGELRRAGRPGAEFEPYEARISKAADQSAQVVGVVTYVSDRTLQLDQAISETQEAAREAKEALMHAERAATRSATSALERSFETTAKSSEKAAWWFRGLTLGTLVLTASLGLWFMIDHTPPVGGNVDWYGVIYRLAILSALAALSAYLARQATHYRRLATWARGIEIQLKAFLGFVNEIKDEDARQTMYALFGKRVLEAPPEGKSGADDSITNIIQPIIENAAKLRANN
ncbi:hypothetical protein [Microbacterium thalassium]|uniref:Uncharacterized protein YdbL (DUF1318 family) n=1 Tax=Microbacterium thalassium TaxID=362649 RepID=A0A7X0FRA6_9MICO|nr:hypothetical protein [Microbacterium thalassium]MBB6392247.1 uncharacterized protein YdbL (DUF1318 family) [Microbacterium thalassium]GLK23458.1 hypothetical protein GCM10017607_07760 [Microbacterium thalassium]